MDVCRGGYSGGGRSIKYNSHVPTADHYLFLGNGVDTGLFDPLFRIVDPDTVEMTIDSLPGTNIGVDDVDSTLATGEYSVFPKAGCIRYSAADTGKTITGTYLYMSDEF